jgi:hypothetical protein
MSKQIFKDPFSAFSGTLTAKSNFPSLDALSRASSPLPPSLQEWLGDGVSELGPWAAVLKDTPPETWEWRLDNRGNWYLKAPGATIPTTPKDVVGAVTWGSGPWTDTCQMALFHHHPSTVPDPHPVKPWLGRTPWAGNNDEE